MLQEPGRCDRSPYECVGAGTPPKFLRDNDEIVGDELPVPISDQHMSAELQESIPCHPLGSVRLVQRESETSDLARDRLLLFRQVNGEEDLTLVNYHEALPSFSIR